MRGVPLPLTGTVSVWPASTTLVGRPSWVRATTLSPTRVTSNFVLGYEDLPVVLHR